MLAGAAIPGLWQHIGTVISEIDRGEAHAHWLYDAASQRFAYLLDFIIRGAPAALPSVLHGQAYAGELCYYPGIHNLRALAKTWEAVAPPPLAPAAHSIAQAVETAQQAYAENPLLSHYPLRVDNVRLARRGDTLALTDGTHALPLALNENERLRLLAPCSTPPCSARQNSPTAPTPPRLPPCKPPGQHLPTAAPNAAPTATPRLPLPVPTADKPPHKAPTAGN